MQYLPQINNIRNEIVFYIGVAVSILLAVAEVIEGWDVDSVSSWYTLVPVIMAAIQRNFAYGPETVKLLKKD